MTYELKRIKYLRVNKLIYEKNKSFKDFKRVGTRF
jgi:hypothetical protein